MKFYVTALVLGICAIPLLFSGCVDTPAEESKPGCSDCADTSKEFEPGTRFEDIFAVCKDAALIHPPTGAFEDGTWQWFLVRIGEDEYCVVNERGLVVRTIKRKLEFADEAGVLDKARYDVADAKAIKEYQELVRKHVNAAEGGSEKSGKEYPLYKGYVGRKLLDVLRTEGRLISAWSYDISCDSTELLSWGDDSDDSRRLIELDQRHVAVVQFVLALNGGQWLILFVDSRGTIVEGYVTDMPSKSWDEYRSKHK